MENKYIANPDVVFRREEDEAILFNPETGDVKLLNRTGALIYRMLDGNNTLADIEEMIIEKFKVVDKDDIRQDIEAFFSTMIHCDFIYTVK